MQCGHCTPGMIMAARRLLGENPDPAPEESRHGRESGLCRCTGHRNIVRAVLAAAAEGRRRRRALAAPPADTGRPGDRARPRRTPPGRRQGPYADACVEGHGPAAPEQSAAVVRGEVLDA
ncbi:2Fe-2S iron-sulfur cluster-binding protein [Streptomyces sp. NPDC048295]|uniref:2Fe-2S iron-sulfur cluster-binding protein n=1 Tax=Streptomyces sp. NPDC048295 TaxID=3154617 RepID=UPI00343B4768